MMKGVFICIVRAKGEKMKRPIDSHKSIAYAAFVTATINVLII